MFFKWYSTKFQDETFLLKCPPWMKMKGGLAGYSRDASRLTSAYTVVNVIPGTNNGPAVGVGLPQSSDRTQALALATPRRRPLLVLHNWWAVLFFAWFFERRDRVWPKWHGYLALLGLLCSDLLKRLIFQEKENKHAVSIENPYISEQLGSAWLFCYDRAFLQYHDIVVLIYCNHLIKIHIFLIKHSIKIYILQCRKVLIFVFVSN